MVSPCEIQEMDHPWLIWPLKHQSKGRWVSCRISPFLFMSLAGWWPSNGRFAFIFHDPTVGAVGWMPIILSIPCADLQGSYIIYNIYSGSWNKIRCLFIGIHTFFGSLALSSDHWRTCKFASHSDVSTMSFTGRSSNQVQSLQSP